MKERPILFSAPMVRALLDGSKTQTRRVVKPSPEPDQMLKLVVGSSGLHYVMDETPIAYPESRRIRWDCPYGQPGDRLWVREAWKAHTTFDNLPPRDIPQSHVWYMADDGYKAESRFRQSMFMPRWASRITLEVTGVRVERLQDISNDDIKAEGLDDDPRIVSSELEGSVLTPFGRRIAFEALWESINGAGSWDANPWVWVVEFKRTTP